MNKWFFLNLLLLGTGIWQLASRGSISVHILFGALGLLFFLFNWTRHAVFTTIRNTENRQTKIKLATFSKKIVPFHRWIGTTALLLIVIHAVLVIRLFGFNWHYPKIVSGLVAGMVLAAMVISGWMRLIRSTARKRMIHIWLGISLFFAVAVHLVL
ncbi:hypothetical protein EU245_05055 [Lentibacillus lipolyticus]|nr:hypothetical protein EU245_05055 [Lentibacillus lipolyticus]